MLRIGGQRIPTQALVLIAMDALIVLIALVLATFLRFVQPSKVLIYLRNPDTFVRFTLITTVCILAMYYCDLHNLQLVRRRSQLFVHLLRALGVACLAMAVLFYIAPDLSPGRGITVLLAPTILLLVLAWRLSLDFSGILSHSSERVLIVGTSTAGISLAREICGQPGLGIKVVGFLDEKGENIGRSLVNPGVIGAVRDVEAITAALKVDRAVLALAERRGRTPGSELLRLKFAGVAVEDVHTVYEQVTGRIPVEHLSPSWLILSDGFRKSPFLVASKRVLDALVSLAVLVLSLPLLLIIALAIWLESGAPILFRQERVGLGGRTFEILKFRSMVRGAEASGPAWSRPGDARVTRVGRFLRPYRLDELPQLLNVFRGDMSLVGPRPEQPHFCAMLEPQVPFYGLRHVVRPGITGWAQIKYQYGASVEESQRKLEYDLFYIKHLSVLLDLAILLETIKVMFWSRGAH